MDIWISQWKAVMIDTKVWISIECSKLCSSAWEKGRPTTTNLIHWTCERRKKSNALTETISKFQFHGIVNFKYSPLLFLSVLNSNLCT